MKNEAPQKPATVGQLKELYQWIYAHCPEKPSKFNSYTKIIYRLIKCQSGSDSSPLKPVHLADYNKINKDHPLRETTFRQRPTDIARYLLQPASERLGLEKRLKMRIKSTQETRRNPAILFEFGQYQPDFSNAIKRVDHHFDDNQWFCEIMRSITTGKSETFTPNQRTFDQAVKSRPAHHPDRLNWFGDQDWETASVFIAITPADKEGHLLEYKEPLRGICNQMNGEIYSNYINEEYIFGFKAASEFYLRQAMDTAIKLQTKINKLDAQRPEEQRPHILMLISEDRLEQDGEKLKLEPSSKNIAYRTKLYNNTEIEHTAILVTPETHSKLRAFYTFDEIDPLGLHKYQKPNQPSKQDDIPFSDDITLLEPDGHLGKVQSLKSLIGTSSVISLTGEIGIGKTRLLYCLFQTLKTDSGFQMSYLSCCDYDKDTPHSFAKAFYHCLIKPTEFSDKPSLGDTSFEDFLENFSTDERPNARVDCPMHFNKEKKWVIAIDNAQWIDQASLNLLNNFNAFVCEHNIPVTIIYSWRYETLKPEGYSMQSVSLNALTMPELAQIAQKINRGILHKKYPKHERDDMAEQADGVPLALIEKLCPDRLPTTYFKKLLCAIDNTSTDQEHCKKIILSAAQIGNHFKIAHIADLMAEGLSEKEQLHHYISNCLGEMKRVHIVKKEQGQWFCFFRENIRQEILKALQSHTLSDDSRNIHKKIVEDLYKNHRQDCDTDPLLISSHLLNLNEVDGISLTTVMKFMRRSAWIEISRNKFDRAKDYFAKILKLTKQIEKGKDRFRFYLHLSISIESLFLDIIHGAPSKTIEKELNHLLEKLQKYPETEFKNGLLRFQLKWIDGCHKYLQGHVNEAKDICQTLIKTKQYSQFSQCKQLIHALRGKIYFKTGQITESITESRVTSAIGTHQELQNQIIFKTSDDVALAQWLRGDTDQAIIVLDNAEQMYLCNNNIRDQITTYWHRILLHTMDYDAKKVAIYIERAERNERKYSIMSGRGFTAMSHYLLTLIEIINGKKVDLDDIEAAMEKLRKHTTLYKPFWKTLLAEAYLKTENDEACARCIDDAFNISGSTGERFYLPETHRVNAELKLKTNRRKEAKDSYDTALNIARQNDTPMLELRALNSIFLNKPPLRKKEKEGLKSRFLEIMKTFDGRMETFDIRNARKIIKTQLLKNRELQCKKTTRKSRS